MGAAISVIMPAFNAQSFIAEALASLSNQGEVTLQVVVVDDGSTDDTRHAIATAGRADPRIALVSVEHGGVSKARNAGLAAARHPLVAFLDADDLCPAGRLQRQAATLAANPAMDVVIGELLMFEALGPDGSPRPGTRSARLLGISLSTGLFRRALFDRHGLFDETLDYCEDLDFYLRLMEAGTPMLFENEIANCYRRHGANSTNDLDAVRRGYARAIHKSLVRRRATGRVLPPHPILLQRHEVEQQFHG